MSKSSADLLANTPLKENKRKRSVGSPESISNKFSCLEDMKPEAVSSNVQSSWIQEIKVMIANINEQMISVAKKDDINILNVKMDKIMVEHSNMKIEIAAIKEENKQLKEKIIDLENKSKRNNLIFRGIPESSHYESVIKEVCRDILGLQNEVDIIQAFPIAKNFSSNRGNVVLAEFASYKDVLMINSNLRKTQNTGIQIHQDFSIATRVKRGKLLLLRREIRRRLPELWIRLHTDTLLIRNAQGVTIKLKWNDEAGLVTTGGVDGFPALKETTGCDFSYLYSKESNNIHVPAMEISTQKLSAIETSAQKMQTSS